MSQETSAWLNQNTLIGFTDKRGEAWHYRASDQGAEPNHYPGAIPVEDVKRRLFDWVGVEGTLTATAITPDGVLTVEDKTRKAVMHSKTGDVLGIFKHGYKIHQYEEWLVNHVARLLDADLAIGSAGLLRKGGVAWVQVELADTVELPEGIEIRPFFTAATSMDGTLSSTYATGMQVTVCDNTLSAALGQAEADGHRVRIRHSSGSLDRIDDIRQVLEILHTNTDSFTAEVAKLTAQVVTDTQWAEFVAAWSGTAKAEDASKFAQTVAAKKSEEINGLWASDPRVAPWAGSAYGVVAAVNTWTHHLQPVRNVRAEANALRTVLGKVDALDASTLKLLASVG